MQYLILLGGFVLSMLFKRDMPEKLGISSACILDFLKALDCENIVMHSVLMIRKSKIIFEGYYAPFQKDTIHRMFSVSKSFVSAAVGILVGEGKLNLDDCIADYFTEKLPENIHPYISAATVRDLLKMESPHEKTAFKQIESDDYVKSFFVLEPSHIPGTVFSYDTSATHVLCALAEKLTGMELIEFLRMKFLDDAGFSKEAYCMKDPMGVSLGGSGLMALPMDCAVFGEIIMNGGRLGNRQIIPKDYIDAAVSKQTETIVKGISEEEKQGYGYQFWRTRNNGFVCYGMAGQLVLCLPDLDFMLVTTADTQAVHGGVQRIYDLFWKHIFENISDEQIDIDEDRQRELEEYRKALRIKPFENKKISETANKINGVVFKAWNNKFEFDDLKLVFDGGRGEVSFSTAKGSFKLVFGMGRHEEGIFPFYLQRCITSAMWSGENEIIIRSYIIGEELGSVYLQICFKNDEAVMLAKKFVGTGFEEFDFIYNFRKEY